LGIVVGIASWLGLNALQRTLAGFDLPVNLGAVPILALIPGLLWGILSFLLYYTIGKSLHLLVDVDERTIQMRQAVEQPAAASEMTAEASGELKRQAKLIAANLEATQDLQRQMATLEGKLGLAPAAVVAAQPPVVAAAGAVDQAAGDVAAAVDQTADNVAAGVEEARTNLDETV
jgi:hypothetical protein